MLDRVCCVVRSVGERTTASCRQLIGDAIGGAAGVIVVGHKPFPATLADSLRAGVSSGKRWTLCVDADVLPLPGAIAALVDEAERLDDAIFEVQPVVLDRFFGGWRPAGVHLYRASHLPRALASLSSVASAIRPEASLLAQMAANGCPWHQLPLEFGLHDFEQAPGDIYRKCFVHAHKHADLKPALARYWRAREGSSDDFAVALEGLAAGEAHTGAIALDATAPYLRARSSREAAMPELQHVDPAALLEAEERALAALPHGTAPVWDWIDSDWAASTRCRQSIDILLRAVLGAGVRPLIVEEADARARILLQAAAEWGIPVAGIVPRTSSGRTFFRGVPVLDPAAHEVRDTIRVRRREDGRFTARVNGDLIDEPAIAELQGVRAQNDLSGAIGNLVRRLSAAGVGQVLVYGAGAAGLELAAALQHCRIAAFVESEPSRLRAATLAAPLLDPERALATHRELDVVIASLVSAQAMVRRLLGAAAAVDSWPGRIWLLDA